MAVANAGCVFARSLSPGEQVLAVDWSLESPGLHRYLLNNEANTEDAPGLIDLIVELDQWLAKPENASAGPEQLVETFQPDRFLLPTRVPSLSILKAGRFDGGYFELVNSFHWQALDHKAPWLLPALVDYWRRKFRFVLIDSRSGVNDLSGLCTMMLPDKLVLMFAPNRHSIEGALDTARYATSYRNGNGEGRPLKIFPVPSRVDFLEGALRAEWRFGAEGGGYQPRFEKLLGELYRAPECHLSTYFTEVQLPHQPRYAFGEQVAALAERDSRTSALRMAYERLSARLLTTAQPWQKTGEALPEGMTEVDGRLVGTSEAKAHFAGLSRVRESDQDKCRAATALRHVAEIEEREGRLEEARRCLSDAISLRRGLDDRAELAASLEDLGRLERDLGEWDRAKTHYREAAEAYRSADIPWQRARCMETLAELALRLDNIDEARSLLLLTLDVHRANHDALGQASVYHGLGEVEKKAGSNDAEDHYYHAIEIFRAERDAEKLAACLRSLADLQRRRNKVEDARRNFEESAELCRGNGDNSGLAHALQGLADTERRVKRFTEALAHFEESISLHRRLNQHTPLASALQGLAELDNRLGRMADARTHLEEAMKLFGASNSQLGVANCLRNLGDVERRLGNIDGARGLYEAAMEIYRSENNSMGQANALQSMGDLEKRVGRWEEAQQRYQEAIQLFRKVNSSLGLANTLKSLGDVEGEAGNFKVARDHYEQAIELYRNEGNQLGVANAMQSLGDLERKRGGFKDAITYYTDARSLYIAEQNRAGLAYTCSELARVSHATFDFAASIRYIQEAIEAGQASKVSSVLDYVWAVQRELRGGAAARA